MATTTNYSWNTPDNTAYVKDGASAIRTLGSSVDTTLFTALGGAYPGLRLVKTQTIGSAVASVNVTAAFSATYDNYKIIVSGGVASGADRAVSLRIGSPANGYYSNLILANYTSGAVTSIGTSNATAWNYAGSADLTSINMNIELNAPFLTEKATFRGHFYDGSNTGSSQGQLNDALSYTDFTIAPNAGTLTGGTIYVYGYGKS